MKKAALKLLQRLPEGTTLLPVQTLGELFNLLVRKVERPPAKARTAILSWRDTFPLIETSAEVMLAAADLATDHRLSIWDSVILSAAAESGCRILLSEDLQEGFTWKGSVSQTRSHSQSTHSSQPCLKRSLNPEMHGDMRTDPTGSGLMTALHCPSWLSISHVSEEVVPFLAYGSAGTSVATAAGAAPCETVSADMLRTDDFFSSW